MVLCETSFFQWSVNLTLYVAIAGEVFAVLFRRADAELLLRQSPRPFDSVHPEMVAG